LCLHVLDVNEMISEDKDGENDSQQSNGPNFDGFGPRIFSIDEGVDKIRIETRIDLLKAADSIEITS